MTCPPESVTQLLGASISRVGPREYSPGERGWDVVICIVLPALCMLLDPGILRASSGSAQALVSARMSVFLKLDWLLTVAALLLAQRFRGRRSPWLPVLAGVLFAGAVSGAALGARMLPLTLLAMVALLGLPGFLPFVSAFGFSRAGLRAWNAGAVGRGRGRAGALALAGALGLAGMTAGSAQLVMMRVETAVHELFASRTLLARPSCAATSPCSAFITPSSRSSMPCRYQSAPLPRRSHGRSCTLLAPTDAPRAAGSN